MSFSLISSNVKSRRTPTRQESPTPGSRSGDCLCWRIRAQMTRYNLGSSQSPSVEREGARMRLRRRIGDAREHLPSLTHKQNRGSVCRQRLYILHKSYSNVLVVFFPPLLLRLNFYTLWSKGRSRFSIYHSSPPKSCTRITTKYTDFKGGSLIDYTIFLDYSIYDFIYGI